MAFLFRTTLLGAVLLCSCKETFFYNSSEYKLENVNKKFEVTEEEAQAIWEKLKARIDAGENIDGTTRALIKLVRSQLAADQPPKPFTLSDDRRAALNQKYEEYLNLTTTALNKYRFVDGCDGLLFTSLLAASGYKTNVSQAESKTIPGRWYRSATQDCLLKKESESTISRDMILGLAVHLWQNKDRDTAENILLYASENNGFIGDATSPDERLGRAYMTPQLAGVLHEIIFRLGGEDNDLRGYIPDFSKNLTGFEAHLQTLRVLLRGAMWGGLLKEDLEILLSQLQRNPNNALTKAVYAAYTNGNMNGVADVLLNTDLFPAAQLPSTNERCEAYLWQREENSSDWKPCPEKDELHPGVDFLFAASYVLEKFRLNGK